MAKLPEEWLAQDKKRTKEVLDQSKKVLQWVNAK
jgi:hypothetical protein